MTEKEDPEINYSHEHNKIASIYCTPISENNLKMSRKDFFIINDVKKETHATSRGVKIPRPH